MRLLLVNNPIPAHNRSPVVVLERLLRVLEGSDRESDVMAANLSDPPPRLAALQNLADWPYDNRQGSLPVKMMRPFLMQFRYALSVLRAPRPDLAVFWIGGRRSPASRG